MKDYAIQIRVANNRLKERVITRSGTMAAFARQYGICYQSLSNLVGLKKSPMKQNGEWRGIVMQIAEALNVVPKDLFPDAALVSVMEKTTAEFTVDEHELEAAFGAIERQQTPEDVLMLAEQTEVLSETLDMLTPRQREVIVRRYGLEGQEPQKGWEVGAAMGIGTTRAQQLEWKAIERLKTLKHPQTNWTRGLTQARVN